MKNYHHETAGRKTLRSRLDFQARRVQFSTLASHTFMKNIIILEMMAVSVLLTGCGNHDDTLVARTKEEAARSQVVGYAIANTSQTTNILFTVTEIWKGSEVASTLGITNGEKYSDNYYQPDADPPDGEIFLLSLGTNVTSIREDGYIYVRAGLIGHMSVQEFKARIGL